MSRVSVVMPARNAEATIERALGSMVGESLIREILVIDDRSSDDTRARVLARGDARIRILEGRGTGISAALNIGIQNVTGDYVARVDADDGLIAGQLGSAVRFLDANPSYAAVSGGYEVRDTKGHHLADLACAGREREVTGLLRSGAAATSFCAWVTRRDVLIDVGGARHWFETAEDLDLQFRLAGLGRIWHRPVPVYRVYLEPASVTHQADSNRRLYYDAAASRFARERLVTGADRLSSSVPPRNHRTASPNRPYRAARHAADLAVGQTYRDLAAGQWRAAIGHAARAIKNAPTSATTWKCLIIGLVRGGRPLAGYLYSISRGERPVARRNA
jgi:glycosyltransferase involved in cell wall biosynthesis